APILGHPRHEDAVVVVELASEALRLLGGEIAERREPLGVRAAGDGLAADPELPEQAAHVHLAAVDPDRAGDRGGPRDDAVRAHRDVVAARGRVVREARDHRLLGATALHLTPDVVACPGVPPRAVDAEHDRADRVALARLVQRLDQGLGAQEPFSVRADVTLAGYDRAAR